MHAPQIILLVWWAIGMGSSIRIAVDAKSPAEPIARLILFTINASLLWWGGFWGQP